MLNFAGWFLLLSASWALLDEHGVPRLARFWVLCADEIYVFLAFDGDDMWALWKTSCVFDEWIIW